MTIYAGSVIEPVLLSATLLLLCFQLEQIISTGMLQHLEVQ